MIKRIMAGLVSGQYRLQVACAALLTAFYNGVFFSKLTAAFPLADNFLFVIAVGLVLFLAMSLVFTLLGGKYTTKPLLAAAMVTAASCGYFMSAYGVVIDATMLQNAVETDRAEVMGLINPNFIIRIILLGIVPGVIIWRWKIQYGTFKQEMISKLSVMALILVTGGIIMLLFSASFASFFREYKSVRYYANPIYPFYSVIKYVGDSSGQSVYPDKPEEVSGDAQIVEPYNGSHRPDRELVILVIGESARADRFQLNGYGRETNPRLSAEKDVVTFTHVTSCGTTTSVSVPCMFSILPREEFESDHIYTHENALNVLKREGVNVLWRDNNSSSKGVADHIEYQDFHKPDTNTLCDGECRDEGMLVGLQDYIAKHPTGDILIVLHQFGSHGPEYYKRYPQAHEFFKPTCKTNKLGDCSKEEITNAYDNTIRYTDDFLSKAIGFLKKNDEQFEAAMFYISDHGESLGEGGIYLHGMPYMIAPDEQKHVAAILWTGTYFDVSADLLQSRKDTEFSHDNIYCTLMSMFEVETRDCKPEQSMFFGGVK